MICDVHDCHDDQCKHLHKAVQQSTDSLSEKLKANLRQRIGHSETCSYDPGKVLCTCGYYNMGTAAMYNYPNAQQTTDKPASNVNHEFIDLLERMLSVHAKKAQDYTASDPDENFRRTAHLISWFSSDHDKAFVNHIGTKLSRLATLLNGTKPPNNESIDDSFLDLANYCVLWYASWKRRQNQESGPQPG